MRAASETIHGRRLRGLIVMLWRARLRISEGSWRSPNRTLTRVAARCCFPMSDEHEPATRLVSHGPRGFSG